MIVEHPTISPLQYRIEVIWAGNGVIGRAQCRELVKKARFRLIAQEKVVARCSKDHEDIAIKQLAQFVCLLAKTPSSVFHPFLPILILL